MVVRTLDRTQRAAATGMPAEEMSSSYTGALAPLPSAEPVATPSGQSPATVLIIEDDRSVNDLLALRLTKGGYRVLQAEDGWRGLDLLRAYPIDLVLLDLMLPSLDGWQTMKRLRELSLVPVLVLTARNQERDEVLGFSLGADDYVVKPFTFARLQARIEALLRRSAYGATRQTELMYRDRVLAIDLSRRKVSVGEHQVELSPTEYRLLLSLVRHGGQVVSHEQLLLEVWGANYDSLASLKAYIGYLRRKIESNPSKPELIHTCWGVGYRYEPSPDS